MIAGMRSCSHYLLPCSCSLIGARHHRRLLTLSDIDLRSLRQTGSKHLAGLGTEPPGQGSVRRYPHSRDCSLASKSAAAFATSNVPAVPSTTRSLSFLLLTLALRRTSHVGTPSCVNTSNAK